MINIDTWVGNCKVRAFDWTDGAKIYLHIEEFAPGQSTSSDPMWENSYLIDRSDEQLLIERLDSIVRGLANRIYKKKEG